MSSGLMTWSLAGSTMLVIGTSEKNQTEFIILLERNLKVYIALAIMTDWLLQPVQLPSSVVSALLRVAGPRLARGRSRNDREKPLFCPDADTPLGGWS